MYYKPICLLIGYAIGCVQVAYTICKMAGGIDIREHGSGNAGTTNVVRVMGPKLGLVVFALDIAKGMLAFALCAFIFGGGSAFFSGELGLLPGMYGALGAVLGHDFPVQQRFRGGKGSATTLGIVLWLDWRIALICYLAGVATVAATRYISVASMLIANLTAVLLFALGYSIETVVIAAALGLLSLYQHRANLGRLRDGKENKFRFKKQI